MTHLNHTPPTLYLIHFLIRETEWGRTADLRWWSEAVKKRGWEGEWERSDVQSLPTAWLHISLQHGTYLSSASHAHEHLTLWFVKEKNKQQKIEAQSMLAHQGSCVQSIPHTSTHSPPFSMHCPPTDNHSAPRHKYFMTLNKAQHIREEQNGTSPSERSQLSPSCTESPIALWMCQSESLILICPSTLEIIMGSPFVVFVYAFLLIKSYGRIQQRLFNCSSWKIDAALKDFFVSRRYWENTGVKATWEHMFYSHAQVTRGVQQKQWRIQVRG